MDNTSQSILCWAASIWPAGFTSRQASTALGTPVKRLDKIHGLTDTRVNRLDDDGTMRRVWRYQPVQLRLPLGDE